MAGLKTFSVRLSFGASSEQHKEYSFQRVNAKSDLSAINKAFQSVRARQGVNGHESYGTKKTTVEVEAIGEPE